MMRTDLTRPARGFAVLISLGAFGASEVLRLGQLHFTRVAAAAGAEGVEVREELLRDADTELPQLATELAARGLHAVYSCPTGLWREDGTLDEAALRSALTAARLLGAARLKMSVGGFGPASADSWAPLKAVLQHPSGPELLIENDQTPEAGSLPALKRFFSAAQAQGLPLAMTFDMGNWHWVGECPQAAAQALGARVGYVHCKGVLREPVRWVAVPLAQSQAPWRTVLGHLPADVPWAIEYPLQGADLIATVRAELDLLRREARRLREARAEPVHALA
ncbi:sugar phosphate isomerase/epimerase family protein [Curvibacter gracilis]|uniref:sugar phosphate isomerase/epimerase family protein n=1 Tax=Curvibacter gracilis TaxID=230310 RepID=UPI000489B238|nr:TIM barrel protein [Curvibacter gracilis]